MSVIPLKSSFAALLLLLAVSVKAQIPVPAAAEGKSILFLNAQAHLGNGEVIPRSAIGVRNGKIDMVLAAIDIRMDSTQYDTIIHLEGKHIYPGLIAPNSRLGLVEIGAVRASRDYDDVGKFNPHVRTLTAYNTESRITPTVRSNGVLVAQVTPKGGRISGSSSVFHLDGWNWEDAVVRKDDGIHLNWPRTVRSHKLKDKNELKKAEEAYQSEIEDLKQFFDEARAYQKVDFHLEKNLRFEAMESLFNNRAKLYIHADQVQQLTDAIYFFDQYNIDLVAVGGNDVWLVADLLKDRDIPILLRRVHSLPKYQDDAVDAPYQLPAKLVKKGLLVGLENSGRMEAMGTRNLPFYAGTAAAYGLDKETALSLITLNTAKILGLDNRLGSLEKGKDATLFISKGDALDMRTNQVEMAFIQGKQIDLDNPQKQLYRKYSKKYE
jgi:imidazolonepropionase-like amidohydrolase